MNNRPEWFAPKSYGYGTGLPIAWEDWALLIGFLLVVIVGAIVLAPLSVPAFLALVVPLTLAFILIAKKTTRGGWRWRWRDDQ